MRSPQDTTHQTAWIVNEFGDPAEVLTHATTDVPTPRDGQTLVEVRTSGVNFADGLVCEGTYQHQPSPPLVPGIEVVGVIAGTSQRVVGTTVGGHGAWAQFALAREADLFPISDEVDDATAAASHVVFQTAWIALHHRARLSAGDTVVVQAAAGATGSAALQVALDAGATVVGVAGGPDKVAAIRAAGAHLALDHRSDDVVAAVRDLTGGRGADITYDPVGSATLETSRRCLSFEGRLLVMGFASGGPAPTVAANHLLVRNLDVVGVAWPAYRDHRPDLVADAQRSIDTRLADGRFAPLVAGVRPMSEACDALGDLRSGTTVGKWVLRN